MRVRLRLIVFMLAVLVTLVGCTDERERVQLPPEAPVEGIRSIAVVGFANHTIDPGLSPLIERIAASILNESDRYKVTDPVTARAEMTRQGITPDSLANPEIAMALANALEVDALLTGAATYYFEDTSITPPQCTNCRSEGRTPYWRVTQRTVVNTTVEARIIRASDGAIIWSKAVDGRDQTTRSSYVNWNRDDAPPQSLVPGANRQDVPETREAAIRNAVRGFTQDLLPRYVWVRSDH